MIIKEVKNKMNKMFRKSQAAMEFLMTYGWAILVVLVAIGALAYFGVLSPDRFLPAKCTLPAGIACTDFRLDSAADSITIALRNGLGFDIDPITIEVADCTSPTTTTLNNGEEKLFIATLCGLSGGSKYSGSFNVSYTNKETTLPHKIQGSITGRTE